MMVADINNLANAAPKQESGMKLRAIYAVEDY